MPAFSALFLLLAGSAPGLEDPGRRKMDDRVYYLHVPARRPAKPRLFVWLHPATGNAAHQFTWWRRSRLFRSGTILLCPQSKGMAWRAADDEAYLTRLLAHVRTTYRVDPARVYLGGHSSGAGFTWYYGLKHQEQFAALVPAAGPGPSATARPAAKHAPSIYVYHSTNDPVFPFERIVKAVANLKRAGFTVHLTRDTRKHGLGPKLVTLVRAVLARPGKRPPSTKP